MARILIIDDDKQIRYILKEMLEQVGFEVDEASDGENGVNSFLKKPADLVITDVFMPRKDGLEAMSEIKRKYPETKFIVMTGSEVINGVDHLSVARIIGAAHTLRKPFDWKDMTDAAIEIIDIKDMNVS